MKIEISFRNLALKANFFVPAASQVLDFYQLIIPTITVELRIVIILTITV